MAPMLRMSAYFSSSAVRAEPGSPVRGPSPGREPAVTEGSGICPGIIAGGVAIQPCRSRGRRRRPRGRGPAAGAVPTQRRCRPAAELRPVPRPVPAREPPRRQPRRRCSVRRRQRPPSRPPSVPPAGCGGRRDGLHQPRLYSGPWAAGRGRECGTRRAASSRRQRGTERKGRRGQGRRGCGSGASHRLTFTSPAAVRALLPRLGALLSPQGWPRPRSASPGLIASPGSPRSARESRTRRAVM